MGLILNEGQSIKLTFQAENDSQSVTGNEDALYHNITTENSTQADLKGIAKTAILPTEASLEKVETSFLLNDMKNLQTELEQGWR